MDAYECEICEELYAVGDLRLAKDDGDPYIVCISCVEYDNVEDLGPLDECGCCVKQ